MLKEAEDLFNEMSTNGVTAGDFIFNIMVQGFLINKSASENRNVVELLMTMGTRGFSPNAETMSMLLESGQNCKEMIIFLKI